MTRGGESFFLQEETKCDWFLESSKMQARKRYICCLQIPWREVPGREKSYLSGRAVLAQEQVPINLPGIHFSWKLEGPDCPRSAFLGLTSRRFYWDKNSNLFNAEVRQFFRYHSYPKQQGLGNMVQKVPLGPIFHHLHVPISFNNLRFCTNGIRSPLTCQSYLVSLFC